MKLYSKLSALGAVLVLTTAFASADTVNFGSGSGSVGYFGYSATFGGAPVVQSPGVNNMLTFAQFPPTGGCNVGRTECQTYSINPGTVWAPAFTGTTWVSYDPNSGPTGGETNFDANGFYTYETNFTTTGGNWAGSVTVAADDTVAVFLNGVQISNFGTIGGDSQCADGDPNCRSGQSSTIFLGSSLAEFNNSGFNLLTFVVDQSGSIDQGLDYVGSVTQTPEPNTLLLLGTGLLGSAGALFRKMRANA